MRLLRSFTAVTALALLAACDLSTGPDVPAPIDPAQDTYATSLGVDIASMTKSSTGLYYKDKSVGDGTAAAVGDSVQVHYTLWLTNGTKVQSSKDGTGGPYRILIGDQSPTSAIAGFQEGVVGMRPGGVRQLVVPPHLGWGNQQYGAVQPNANVVFELEYVAKIGT